MRPVEIPDDKIIEGFDRVFVGPPPGDEDRVEGVHALFRDAEQDDPPIYACLIQLRPEDINSIIENGGQMWLLQVTNSMVPFSFAGIDEFPYKEGTQE